MNKAIIKESTSELLAAYSRDFDSNVTKLTTNGMSKAEAQKKSFNDMISHLKER